MAFKFTLSVPFQLPQEHSTPPSEVVYFPHAWSGVELSTDARKRSVVRLGIFVSWLKERKEGVRTPERDSGTGAIHNPRLVVLRTLSIWHSSTSDAPMHYCSTLTFAVAGSR